MNKGIFIMHRNPGPSSSDSLISQKSQKNQNQYQNQYAQVNEVEMEIYPGTSQSTSIQSISTQFALLNKLRNNQAKIDDARLDNVVINSNLRDDNPLTQARNVLTAFNINVVKDQSAFETSLVMGQWVTPDQYILGACNQIPELRFFDGAMKIRRAWYMDPTINTEILDTPGQADLIFGAYGSYVLNVPVNKLAKGWSGNTPFLYSTGPHVIHDANFRFDARTGLVDQAEPYINHGSIHILRVPAGMIAKVWVGTIPYLLESREEPYVFNSALFVLDKKDANTLFFSATEELIIHGSIKRVMPRTGREAVSYNNGILEIIKPNEKNEPTIINSSSHAVEKFINTNVQNKIFPSDEEKTRRLNNNKNISPDELNHYVYMTRDSLKIGVQLVVSFRIVESHKAVKQLGVDKILSTIENLAAVDMGKMVNRLSSQEFLNPVYKKNGKNLSKHDEKSKLDENASKTDGQRGEEDVQPSFWGDIREELSNELNQYGVELIRFNTETPIVFNKDIANKMAECATMTAEANAKQAIIQRQAKVQEAEATRDANTKRIEQEQINTAIISHAEAEFQAQKYKADGLLLEAQAKAKSIEIMGKAYKDHPELLELEKVKYVSEAMGKMKLVVPFPSQPIEHVMNTKSYESFGRFFGGAGLPKQDQSLVIESSEQTVMNVTRPGKM
jgi:regulator of protease activity HflC (stomatin/prohibitin superfamily)